MGAPSSGLLFLMSTVGFMLAMKPRMAMPTVRRSRHRLLASARLSRDVPRDRRLKSISVATDWAPGPADPDGATCPFLLACRPLPDRNGASSWLPRVARDSVLLGASRKTMLDGRLGTSDSAATGTVARAFPSKLAPLTLPLPFPLIRSGVPGVMFLRVSREGGEG